MFPLGGRRASRAPARDHSRPIPPTSCRDAQRLAPANPRPPRSLLPTPPRSSIQPRAHPAPTAPTESPAPKDRPRQSSLLHGRRTAQVVCSTPAATSSLRRVLRYYRRCAMQCPHHSNRLCPAHRSHPRPDHQPCPPPSPCESHPRHRAAPARARCDFHRSPAHRAPLHEISATREALSKLRTWNVCSPRQRERSPPSCQRVVLRCAVSARPLAKSGAPRGVAASRLATLARAASGYGYAFASLSPPREALPLQFARPARVAASRVCRHRATPAVSPAARLRRGKARVAREAYRARALAGAPSRSPASGGNMLRASLARWRGATEFNAARFIAHLRVASANLLPTKNHSL